MRAGGGGVEEEGRVSNCWAELGGRERACEGAGEGGRSCATHGDARASFGLWGWLWESMAQTSLSRPKIPPETSRTVSNQPRPDEGQS